MGGRSRAGTRARHISDLFRMAVLSAALVVGTATFSPIPARAKSPSRPNIVLILTDDQRWDSLDQMPKLNTAPEWARFTEAFVDEPLCCPSRASILTGRYPQHTGVQTQSDVAKLNDHRTVATMLHDAGYRTGLFGKYLNNYASVYGRRIPPGWDRFVAYLGATDYDNYKLNENGTPVSYGSAPKDYSTDVWASKARRFITSTKRSQPLFLDLALNAPHLGSKGRPVAALRHRYSCADKTFEQPPSFNAHDTVSEPSWMSAETPVDANRVRILRTATCKTLLSVDEAVTSIITELKRAGRLNNTYLIFTSDNGYHFGEHRLLEKGDLYEEAIRVPLLVRGPNVKPGTIGRLTSNVDLLPTILDWAKVSPPRHFLDGAPFTDYLRGKPHGSDPAEVLLRGCRTGGGESTVCGGGRSNMGLNWGLRTATHKYIEYPDGSVQLFDLTKDPSELTNLALDAAQAALIADLHARLERARAR